MKNTKLLFYAIINSLGVFAYTIGVWWVMSNAPRIIGPMESFWGPVAFLLLFVLSATVVGLLVLGRPAYLYFNGAKREGVKLLLYTLSFLFLIILIVLMTIP